MKINVTDTDIRNGIDSAIASLTEDGQINVSDEIKPDFTDDCVNTVIDWYENYENTHVMTETDYAEVVLDMARIYDCYVAGQVINASGKWIDFDASVNLMDDDIREDLHSTLAPCTDQEFFSAYEKAHLEKYGEEWELSKENPCW